jgi:hypothetical protein
MSANIDDVDPRNHDNIFEMTLVMGELPVY